MPLGLLDAEVRQDSDVFMLSKADNQEYLLKAWVNGEWLNQYGFNLYPQEWIDFGPANYLNSTHPDAIFVQKLLVVLHTPIGRKILFGDSLKRVEHQNVIQQTVLPEQTISILAEEFGLKPV
jgi:N-hydroxyarylamine O-acetyltransferase